MKSLQEFINQLENLLPKGEWVSKHELKNLVESLAQRLDLVTREEFDAQTAVLQKTRQLLETLEAKVTLLESGNQTESYKK